VPERLSADPDSSVCIRRSRSRQPLAELSLVLTAVTIDHLIDFDSHHWCLWVAVDDVAAANEELEKYQRENVPARTRERRAETIDSGWFGVFGYLLVIWALPSLEGAGTFGWDWREIGVMHAARVTQGEWWRTLTALTLHGDLAHLVANSLFGAVFGLFVGRYLGSGLGWLLVLLAGASGNAVNAFIQNAGFRSVGASTATFAALALVGAFVWRRGYMRGWDWRRRFAPVFGGIAMLAYTGFGGGDTDVMAHVTGFGSGLVLGLLVGSVDVRRLGRLVQVLCAGVTLGLLGLAWALAGASG
jgi:membrane associated rhomboid family serine protease